MWICTPIGFFSVVQKPAEQHLTIRARVAQDLTRLRENYLPELGKTISGAGTDYAHRAHCSHKQWGEALAKMAGDIDYSNFKGHIKRTQGASRANIYSGVWSQLWELNRLDRNHEET